MSVTPYENRFVRSMSPNCCIIASSTGLLLKTTGLKVTAIKIDPYMNIDAGTMRPQEHGMSRIRLYGFFPTVCI